MMDDDTVQLSPQQVAIRNAVHDLMDRQLAQYSFERLIATIPVLDAFYKAGEAEQRLLRVHLSQQLLRVHLSQQLLRVHLSQQLLRVIRRELQARRDALVPPASRPPLH